MFLKFHYDHFFTDNKYNVQSSSSSSNRDDQSSFESLRSGSLWIVDASDKSAFRQMLLTIGILSESDYETQWEMEVLSPLDFSDCL